MSQIAVYDALNSIKPKFKPYALTNFRDKIANADAAVASAAYWTLKNINAYLLSLPASSLALQTAGNNWDAWYSTSLSGIPDGESKNAGIELGKKAADAIMSKRADDNYAQANIVYVSILPPAIPPSAGVWRPTISQSPVPPYHTGGLPFWNTKMRTFGGMSNDQFRPGLPPSLLSVNYVNDYIEVQSLGARTGSARNTEQSQIANFWQESMLTQWNRFCRSAISNKKMDAWRTARLLAMANTAMFDGMLTSFDGIYHYKTWRPESAIRMGAEDGNDQTSGDPLWLPFVTDIKIGPSPQTPTPPIPDYPNSNTALVSAVTRVLQLFFETDHTQVEFTSMDPLSTGLTRHYSSFSEASTEFLNSRIYAGFSFRFSLDAGNDMGKSVGEYVYTNVFRENQE
jgi:hypothetical protein